MKKEVVNIWESIWSSICGKIPEPDPMSIKIMDDILSWTHNLKGHNICEVGSGSGVISALLAKQGFKVTLLDLSRSAINISKNVFSNFKVSGNFIMGDLFAMPFKDNTFDMVWNSGVLEHFEEKKQIDALCEMARITKQGGLILTYNPYSKAVFYRIGKWYAEKTGKWEFGPEFPVKSLKYHGKLASLSNLKEYLICAEYQLNFLSRYILKGTRRVVRYATAWIPKKLWLRLFGGYLLVSVFRKEEIRETAMLDASDFNKSNVCMFARTNLLRLPPAIDEGTSLAKHGFMVYCIGIKEGREPFLEEIVTGFTIERIQLITKILPLWIIFRPLRYTEYCLKSVLIGLIKRPALCIAHDLPAVLPAVVVGKLRKTPTVFRVHELFTEGKRGKYFYWKWLEKYFWKHVDTVIVPNYERAEFLIKKYGQPKKLLVVQNVPPYSEPIKTNKLKEYLQRSGILDTRNVKIVLYAGGFSWDRSIEELIKAAQFLPPQIAIVLMGWGEDRYLDKIKKTIEGLNLTSRVFLHPPVSYSKVMEFIASADVGVALYKPIESNAYYCAPHKVFDYIMSGKPVVVSDSPPLQKLVEDEGIGICVDPDNPKDIAKGILYLLEDNARYEKMKNNALRIAKVKYNWEVEFNKLYTLYQDLLGNKLQ